MLKHERQYVVCLPFHLHSVGTGPSEIRTENLCTLVATPGQGAGKHGIREDSVVQAMVAEHAIIGAESSRQGWVRNVPHTTLSGALDCPLGLV